jgi:hypothetical protein
MGQRAEGAWKAQVCKVAGKADILQEGNQFREIRWLETEGAPAVEET